MQTSPSRRRRKAIAVQVILLVAAFAAGWYSPAWIKFNFTKNAVIGHSTAAKTPAAKLTEAQADLAKILRTSAGNNRERDLLDLASRLDAKTLQSLIANLTKQSITGENEKNISILLARLVELNPSAALASLKSLHAPYTRMKFAVTAFDAWSAKDPQAALAAVSQLPADDLRYMSRKQALMSLIDQDPSAALAALRNQTSEQMSEFMYKDVFSEWANHDPSLAAVAALKLPPSYAQDQALQGVAAAWAEQDSAGALSWANALPAGQQKSDAIHSVILAMSEQDPNSAADEIMQIPNNPNRDSLIFDVATNWAQTDSAGLLTWADKNLTGGEFDRAAQIALTQMGQTDPVAATAALAQIPDPNVISQVAPELAMDLAGQNVQAAMQWVQSLSTDNMTVRNSAFSNVLKIWTNDDPAGAASYIQQNLATDPSFSTIVTQVVNTWGNSNPQAALAWAQDLPPGNAQSSALVAAITTIAKSDPQTAWSDIQQLSGRNVGQAQVNVIAAWANQQPAQAAAALQNLPQDSNLNTATADVAKSWLSQDPPAATQWIGTLPQGSARDSAVTQLISSIGNNDPAVAFNWATSLGNETTRNTQVVKLAGQWSSINPAAAAAAAQNALSNLPGLTPAQQTSLQKVVDKAPAP